MVTETLENIQRKAKAEGVAKEMGKTRVWLTGSSRERV
jgi:hypothetical protein